MKAPKRKKRASSLANRRRSQILAAAVEPFAKRGFYETEVEDIAKEAGISKGTIYNYFADKRSLFMATIEWGLNRLSDRIDESGRGVTEPVLKLETAMETCLAFFQSHRYLYRIIFLHRSTYRDKAELRFTKKYLAHFCLFEGILAEGIEQKAFKSVDARLVSFAIVGIIHALCHQWLLGGESRKLAGNVSEIKKLVFNGIERKEGYLR